MAADSANDVLEPKEIKNLIAQTTKDMQHYADEMEFEKAAAMRDRLLILKDMDLGLKAPSRALLNAPAKADDEPKAGTPGGRKGKGYKRASGSSRGKGGGPPHGKTGIGPRKSR
jgi:excinuclease ABC subunit B